MVQTLTSLRHFGLLVAFIALPSVSLAHRLDEYLQATLVSIAPNEVRLHINLTPGVAVAQRVLARIDRNRDNLISTNEVTAYGEALKRDLIVQLDQHNVGLKLAVVNFPMLAELRTGWGIIQMEFSAVIGPLTPGAHQLNLKNRHLPALSVYLLNAAQPQSTSVRIVRQKRNKNQSSGEIEFYIEPRKARLKSPSALNFAETNLFFAVQNPQTLI